MSPNLKWLWPLFKTVFLLIILEIIGTTFLPVIGLSNYKIPFNVMVVLFLGFKSDSPYLPIFIFVIQYSHSLFSVEGWAMGTIAGIMVCAIIRFLKELLHLSSVPMTILLTQVFQTVWFAIVSVLVYSKVDNFSYLTQKFYRFIPESLIMSIMAPLFFIILEKFWSGGEEGRLGDEV